MGQSEDQKYIGGQVHEDTATAWDKFCKSLKAFSRKDLFGAAILYFLELPLAQAKKRVEQYANDYGTDSAIKAAKQAPDLTSQDLERIATAAVQAALQQAQQPRK